MPRNELNLSPHSNLFLSPHPDDLVYSAFAAVTRYAGEADAIIFFNSSRFTKWGLLPKKIVTATRTLEEKLILSRLGLKSSFVWLNDSSCKREQVESREIQSHIPRDSWRIGKVFCPLGIAGHPDHVALRDAAVEYWLKAGRRFHLFFYEDLPYAERIDNVDTELRRIIITLSKSSATLSVCYWPLNTKLFERKLFFSTLYVTQNDQRVLLKRHGRVLGRICGSPFAERYVYAEGVKDVPIA